MKNTRKITKTGRPVVPDKPVITQKLIQNYVRAHTEKAKAEAALEELRTQVLGLFHAGARCDRNGWNILTLSSYERVQIDWEEKYQELLNEVYPNDTQRAHERINKLKTEAPKKLIEAILPRPWCPGL